MYRLRIKVKTFAASLKSYIKVMILSSDNSLGSLKIIASWYTSKGFRSSFSSDLRKDIIYVIRTCTFSMCNSFKIISKGFWRYSI